MDRLTPEQRRKNMQAVKASDSKIELKLRKELFKRGYRFRKNYKKLIGKPDVVFVSKKIAIFCDSEFWHGKDWERKKYEHKSNRDFWFKKIEGNIQRDLIVNKTLRRDGWIVLRFWGKDIERNIDKCLKKIEREIEKRKS